jgi:outer membrane lipoprotein-sorting protein
MTRKAVSLLLLCLLTCAVAAQQPEVVTVMSKALADIPDKEGVMITVAYPPGGADPVHRHNAQAFV